MTQFMLAALFVLSIGFLTFAAAFAEAPTGDFRPVVATQR